MHFSWINYAQWNRHITFRKKDAQELHVIFFSDSEPKVECEKVPSICSEFLTFNQTSRGTSEGVMPFVKSVYTMFENSSCLPDLMKLACSTFFLKCSMDGPGLFPCKEFCQQVFSCIEKEAAERQGEASYIPGFDNYICSWLPGENGTQRCLTSGKLDNTVFWSMTSS